MRNHKLNQTGFTVVEGLIILVIVAVLGFVGWRVLSSKKTETHNEQSANHQEMSEGEHEAATETGTTVSWQFNGSEWSANGTPPACPEPIELGMPVAVERVKAVLYPGQVRGNDYKAHGGFLLTTTNGNDAEIKLPLDATPWRGARYIERGEVQYLFDFVNSCGIMYRFDHLLTLSEKYQKLADTLPAPQVDASGTHNFNNPSPVKKGEVIATAVGFKGNANVSFDLGVYDLRKPNAASATNGYATKSQNKKEQAFYAVCWLDWLGGNTKAIKALPGGDGQMGKTSDYCK